ncbi:hypothetical protein FRB94_009099 [Tulasnella sp. JGI-2019a]|nr:hypothetical protein FRB94_009099 [Tulasnella sp. JGI-2019a]
MLRLVRSVLRTADRFIQAPSPPTRLKQPLNDLIHSLKGGVTTHTPGSVGGANRALSTSTVYNIPRHAHRSPPFKSTLSLPARIALQRPMSNAPFLPRTPTLPRPIAQVGLGTARNFSSTRHVFQNLVENVPVTGRAFWEADWDIKSTKAEKRRLVPRRRPKKTAKIVDKVKAREAGLGVSSTLTEVPSTFEEEFSTYFSAPVNHAEGTTTFLTIPLYPTSERAPLPALTESSRLLPMSELRAIHGDHALHAIRVQSLFTRLDTGDVWNRGIECECYGGSNAAPTALRITFKGWTKEMVHEVIGEAGKGWCELEEVGPFIQPDTPSVEPVEQAAMSFIIPNLDFSSSFMSQSESSHVEVHDHLRSATPFSGCDWTPFSTHPPSPSLTALSQETFDAEDYDDLGTISEEEEFGSDGGRLSLGFGVEFLSRASQDVQSHSFSEHEGW